MKIREGVKDIVPYSPGKKKDGAHKLASNENPLGPSPAALAAVRAAAAEVNFYPDAGSTALKAALAAKHGLSPAHFVTGNGSDEIIQFAAWACMDNGDEAVTSECSFSEYTFAAKLAGGTMRYAPMREGRFDLDAIAALVGERTRVVFLCNPNNPTGTYFGAAALDSFLAKVGDRVLVVLDEAYKEYVDAQDYPDSQALLATRKNVLILRTFSKIYGLAGMRVGYGIGHPELIGWLEKTREPFNVNSLAQAAATAALGDAAHVERSRALNAEGKVLIERGLDRLGLPRWPSQSNFICFDSGRDCMAMFEAIMELGVTVRPLRSFGLSTWLRVSTGTREQNEAFLSCLERALKTVPAAK